MLSAMRLDSYLYERGYAASRTEAKRFITENNVSVNGVIITKPAFDIDENGCDSVKVTNDAKKYVSRGGIKLEAALKDFDISVEGKLALDVGSSSGGFTDCLLKNGAKHVIAVDSGTGQMNPTLSADQRVTLKEGFNARYMSTDDLGYTPELAVMDVSFISATLIIGAVYSVLAPDSDFVCLIKPQFEVGRGGLSKGGIVKDEKLRRKAIDKVVDSARAVGFTFCKVITSPIEGGDGNVEYLAHFKKESGL